MLTVEDLIQDLDLQAIAGMEEKGGGNGPRNPISAIDLRTPGLELVGYFNFFPPGQILLFGPQEVSYLNQLFPDKLLECLTPMFARDFPCIVVAGKIDPVAQLLKFCDDLGRPLIRSSEDIHKIGFKITNYLHLKFVPRKIIHGVLLDVFGVGIMILGSSGTGKSECALELVKRGHRLVADDSVEVLRVSENTLIGFSNSIIGHHMEIRGLGIIDIGKLFGVAATATEKRIDLITQFEHWDDQKEYDRIGTEENNRPILEVNVPCKVIPVRAGRNLSILVETAAMDFNLRKIGINSARSFSSLVRSRIQAQGKKITPGAGE